MRHPAEYFIKYLLVKNPTHTNNQILKEIMNWGFLTPEDGYLDILRSEVKPPQGFQISKTHRASVKFLREMEIYDLFFPDDSMNEAWSILTDYQQRMAVEQVLLAKLNLKESIFKLNKKNNWKLTEKGVNCYGHFFWKVKLLTFDEWGRFLHGRTAMYERYMDVMLGPPNLTMHHLRLDATIESKDMIKRAQEIAYFALEEVGAKPGVQPDKVKAISMLSKAIVEGHNALSTSDIALKEVLRQFEKFRMVHPESQPPDILRLAPTGNYSGSGVDTVKENETKE